MTSEIHFYNRNEEKYVIQFDKQLLAQVDIIYAFYRYLLIHYLFTIFSTKEQMQTTTTNKNCMDKKWLLRRKRCIYSTNKDKLDI